MHKPTFFNGLPFHVLVVHAVVVLVPLAVLGTVTIAVWPAARRRYGGLVVGLTLVAMIAIPIATSSGERLRDRLPRSALIHAHAELGDQLLVLVAPLLVVAAALVAFDLYRKRRPNDGQLRGWLRAGGVVLSAVTVILAVLAGVQVVRVGDSGAKAAWSDTQYTSAAPGR